MISPMIPAIKLRCQADGPGKCLVVRHSDPTEIRVLEEDSDNIIKACNILLQLSMISARLNDSVTSMHKRNG